jgi:hypothetical protein
VVLATTVIGIMTLAVGIMTVAVGGVNGWPLQPLAFHDIGVTVMGQRDVTQGCPGHDQLRAARSTKEVRDKSRSGGEGLTFQARMAPTTMIRPFVLGFTHAKPSTKRPGRSSTRDELCGAREPGYRIVNLLRRSLEA